MATETGEGLSQHVRSVTVTTVATVSGSLAGIGSALLAGSPTDTTGLYLLVAAIVLQAPVLYAFGIDFREFGAKDNLYVVFMTFALWFVSWSILLTAGAFQ
jgi:hypothetical protein